MLVARIVAGGTLPIIAGAAEFARQGPDPWLPNPPLRLLLGLLVGLLLGPRNTLARPGAHSQQIAVGRCVTPC